MDVTHLDRVTEEDAERLVRYLRAHQKHTSKSDGDLHANPLARTF